VVVSVISCPGILSYNLQDLEKDVKKRALLRICRRLGVQCVGGRAGGAGGDVKFWT
jgi:hypothetical protein